MNRRDFVRTTVGATLAASASSSIFAQGPKIYEHEIHQAGRDRFREREQI